MKDQKLMVPGDPLPARPVCGAVRAHNGQLGFMLVKVIDAVSDILAKQNGTESISTEDTIATIEEKINSNLNIPRFSILFNRCEISLSKLGW